MNEVLVVGAGVITAGIGWVLKMVFSKIIKLEQEASYRPTREEVHKEVHKALAPSIVEYKALNRRLDDLQESQNRLISKLDRLLEFYAKQR